MGPVPAAGPAGRESDRRGRARGLRRGMGRHAAGARACGGCRCWTLTPGGLRTTTPARTSRRRPTGCAGARESVGALVMDQKKTGERNVQKMRTKVLRGDDDGILLLFYPATIDEYGRALAALERPGGAAGRRDPDAGLDRTGADTAATWSPPARSATGGALPDLAASGRVRVADEGEALGLLREGSGGPAAVDEPPAEAAPPPGGGRSAAAALEAVRALVTPGARVEQVVGAIDEAGLPHPVSKSLRRALRRALASQAKAVEEVLDRAGMVVSLPWRTRDPARFDPAHLQQALDRTHAGLKQVKTRLIEVLAACPADSWSAHGGGAASRRGAGDTEGRAGRAPRAVPGPVPGSLPGRPPGYGKNVTGRGRRRGNRPHPRARAAGHVQRRAGGPRSGGLHRRANRPGPARGRGEQPGLHPRAARPGGGRRPPTRCSICSTPHAAASSGTRTSMSRSTCPAPCGS